MNDTPGHFLLACLGVVYVGYTLYFASRVVSQDYWRGLRAYELLQERTRALETASLTDTLTGVANRMHFNKCYADEWARAHREGQALALLLIDLDHFKAINDGFGHAAGDMALREAAQAMQRELLRPGDSLARFGGEEFVVVLPDTDGAGAAAVAERLRRAVAHLQAVCGWPERAGDLQHRICRVQAERHGALFGLPQACRHRPVPGQTGRAQQGARR
ncbi:MAG: GGDEF domain-containing protein [Aquabacterium sp.]